MMYISQLAATVHLDKQTYGNHSSFFRPLASGDPCEYCHVMLYEFICHTEIWKYGGDVEDGHVVMANSYNRTK